MHNTMTGHGLESLLRHFNSSPNPVSCVVFDSFLPRAPKIAAKLGIPHAFFWTQSITVFSLYYHFKTVERWDGEMKLPETFNFPSLGDFEIGDLPGPFHRKQDLKVQKVFDFFGDLESVTESSWVLVNSFEELETGSLEYMKRLVRSPVITVGPSIPSAFLDQGNLEDIWIGAGPDPWEGSEGIIRWLDCKPPLSVLYISFGTITSVSPVQIRELAAGLEKSQQSFLWVIRPSQGHHDLSALMPPGFLERIKERGLLVDWCVQLEVLSHPSVGPF